MTKYLINPGDRERTQRAIDEIKERYASRKAFTIETDDAKPRHTDSQRGYYWKSLTDFGKFLGMRAKESEEVIHREIKCRVFGVERDVAIGNSIIQVPRGSSAKADKQTYSELIEELILLAAENGYTVPPPSAEESAA